LSSVFYQSEQIIFDTKTGQQPQRTARKHNGFRGIKYFRV